MKNAQEMIEEKVIISCEEIFDEDLKKWQLYLSKKS